MNRPGLFLTWEMLKAARRNVGGLLLWALTIAVTLAAGTALLLLPAGGRSDGPITEAFLIAGLSVDLSEAAVDELAWQVWAWPEVTQVSFRFPGEQDPVPVEARSLVVKLSQPAARTSVEQKLGATPGITGLTYVERTVKPPPRIPVLARVLALIGLALAGAAAIALGRLTVEKLARSWGNALELLRSSGLPESTLRIPFLAIGALVGLVGGGLYVALLWGALAWAVDDPAVRELVPQITTCGPLASGLGVSIGLVLGVLGGLVGFPSRRGHS
ncbi:hypothetical protein DRJ54_07190 [Candidatus Acetothermia bacterium]|nr:MAG: hypothetical protein DRJ54_07190 [Candidatus Acetothermia bacterium]